MSSATVSLRIHDEQFSSSDIVVSSALLPKLKQNSLLELTWRTDTNKAANSNATTTDSSPPTAPDAPPDAYAQFSATNLSLIHI